MPNVDESVVFYDMYEDVTEYYGSTEITMPNLQNITQIISGAGIAGNVETALLGFVDVMTMGIKFRTATAAAIRLAEPRRHRLDLRVIHQAEDTSTGEITHPAIKYVVSVVPKSLNLGSVKPASPADVSGEYSVKYLAMYLDGKKVTEIDPLNFIYMVNGVDYLADLKNAVGK